MKAAEQAGSATTGCEQRLRLARGRKDERGAANLAFGASASVGCVPKYFHTRKYRWWDP